MTEQTPPVAIIGAGPIGLAAAAQLIRRGETPLIFEASDAVGNSVRQWQHVSMFSPWGFNTDKAAVALLHGAGWTHPPQDEIPTGGELVARYLEPLAALPVLRSRIRFGARVTAVTRAGFDKVRTEGRFVQPFLLRVAAAGAETNIAARAVIDASGTWGSPNPAGADGLPALGEREAADRIFYGIPNVLGAHRRRYAGKSVAVVGGGHSALNALIELAALKAEVPQTRILWIMRKDKIGSVYGGEADDALPARGALGSQARQLVESGAVRILSPFRISRIEPSADGALALVGGQSGIEACVVAAELIVATGFRPDLAMLREIRLTLDPWLESSGTLGPLIDPNLHSCGTVRPHGAGDLAHVEPGFFIVGMKSYGRAPTFLLATGHEQVRSVVAALTGDTVGAARVELALPETGVCSSRPLPLRDKSHVPVVATSGCCGTAG